MMKHYDPSQDPLFQTPIFEVDEWREQYLPDGSRVLYRCMQGAFAGTNVRFHLLFPEKDNCSRRFLQCLMPAPCAETVGREATLALQNGACYVENTEQAETPWKANAAVAELSRRKAREIYGPERFFGYVYGGDGNAYRALACIENASAWDGAALAVPGPQTILFDALDSTRPAMTVETREIGETLTALADWVERGVRPRPAG